VLRSFEDEDGILIYAAFTSFEPSKRIGKQRFGILSSGFEILKSQKNPTEDEMVELKTMVEIVEGAGGSSDLRRVIWEGKERAWYSIE
jgi:hypothetical protein